jgi:hypothetical protein
MERRAGAEAQRAAAAEQHAQAATDAANQQVAKARGDAAREVAVARDSALRAQTIGDVLAAPDLVRYALTGGDEASRWTGQLLWSRSRGLVFSGSRLPQPPPDMAYEIWLVSAGAPVPGGVFVPDAAGRATFATGEPRPVSRPEWLDRWSLSPSRPSPPAVHLRRPARSFWPAFRKRLE